VWPIIPPEASNAPRAPWWNYEKSAEFFGDFLANPRAAIVGYLCDYSAQVPADLLQQLTDAVVEHTESLPEDKVDMHDLLCIICLVESTGLGERERQRLLEKVKRAAPHTVTKDPEKWSGYSAKPLWLAPAPNAPLAEVLAAEVQVNLDYEKLGAVLVVVRGISRGVGGGAAGMAGQAHGGCVEVAQGVWAN